MTRICSRELRNPRNDAASSSARAQSTTAAASCSAVCGCSNDGTARRDRPCACTRSYNLKEPPTPQRLAITAPQSPHGASSFHGVVPFFCHVAPPKPPSPPPHYVRTICPPILNFWSVRIRASHNSWLAKRCRKIRVIIRKKQNGMVLLGTTAQRKLALPHDANRVVQTKKETNPKPKEEPQTHTEK